MKDRKKKRREVKRDRERVMKRREKVTSIKQRKKENLFFILHLLCFFNGTF
jgi:hypothetical protein